MRLALWLRCSSAFRRRRRRFFPAFGDERHASRFSVRPGHNHVLFTGRARNLAARETLVASEFLSAMRAVEFKVAHNNSVFLVRLTLPSIQNERRFVQFFSTRSRPSEHAVHLTPCAPVNTVFVNRFGKLIKVHVRNRKVICHLSHRRGNDAECPARLIVKIYRQNRIAGLR